MALDDPYSCYYTADEYQTLMESTSGSYEGIGVVVSQNVQTKIITVVRPFEGCPGAEAGMLPGDILIEVAGNDVSWHRRKHCCFLDQGRGRYYS